MNRMNVVPFQQQQPYGALNVTSQPLAQGTQLDGESITIIDICSYVGISMFAYHIFFVSVPVG